MRRLPLLLCLALTAPGSGHADDADPGHSDHGHGHGAVHAPLAGHDADAPAFHVHGDVIPDFGAGFDVASVRSGAWSDPATWDDNGIPRSGQVVRITAGARVLYDLDAGEPLGVVGIGGTLSFSTRGDTELRVGTLLVYPGGRLEIGSVHAPIPAEHRAEVLFVDSPGVAHADPFQFSTGLLAFGDVAIHGTATGRPFIRLARAVPAGSRTLALAEFPLGWSSGDLVLLTGSDPRTHALDPEIGTIESIRGKIVSLREPVSSDLRGWIGTGSADTVPHPRPYLPHAANITRNVVLRSSPTALRRGHTLFFRGSHAAIANAEFRDLGRTGIEPLDSARVDADSGVVHPGHNQVGRYPIHLHHYSDATNTVPGRPAFSITGSVVRGGPRWGIAVHGTHFGVVSDNIVFDIDGAGIVTEDGSEVGSVFSRNLVAVIHGSGEEAGARPDPEGHGHEGSGFWMASDRNHLIDNVVAGARTGAFTFFRSETAVDHPELPAHLVEPPVIRNNEAYGVPGIGLELWRAKSCPTCLVTPIVIEDTVLWNVGTGVHFDYHADSYAVRGVTVLGSGDRSNGETVGIRINNSRSGFVSAARVEQMTVGLEGGGNRNRGFAITDSLFRADVGVRLLRGAGWTGHQYILLDNVRLSPPAVDTAGSWRAISLDDAYYEGRPAHRTVLRPVYLVDFQGVPGNHFELFYPDQAPEFLIPQGSDPSTGCPEAGLSNAQCLARHGLATGGRLAACGDSLPHADGFACRIDAPVRAGVLPDAGL